MKNRRIILMSLLALSAIGSALLANKKRHLHQKKFSTFDPRKCHCHQ